MKHPPYHLRPNKAIDRFAFMEAIRRVCSLSDISEYTYYGMGGPFLEDFRLLYEFYPELGLISIERDEETYKRQLFHAPCRRTRLRLERSELKSFLAQYEPSNRKSIFWLDYTRLEYGNFDDLMTLTSKVVANSLIKITLPADPRDFTRNPKLFREQFEALMPDASADPPTGFPEFAAFVQNMVRIAAQRALPAVMPTKFLPLTSFYYADSARMFTLTGIVCLRDEEATARRAFSKSRWQISNLDWAPPLNIDIPTLSTKERLHLQRQLPCRRNAGRTLRRALGYLVDTDNEQTELKLQQYADYHQYFPYFMKAVP